jgi:hypothetical protein
MTQTKEAEGAKYVGTFSCAWAASRKQDEFNVEKFGEGYKAYSTMVPAWNVLNGLRRRLLRGRGER